MASLAPKVSPGDPLSFPATLFNTLVDLSAQSLKDRKSGGAVEIPIGFGPVRVRRAAGTDGPATPVGHIVALGAAAVTPETNLSRFMRQPIFDLLTEFSEDDGARPFFGVLLDPLLDRTNASARVQVDGVACVRLRVVDDRDRWADVEVGSTTLVSNWCGSAEIIWKEPSDSVIGSTGSDMDADDDGQPDRWAYVRLNSRGPRKFFGKTSLAVAGGSSGLVTVYRLAGDTGSGESEEEEGEEVQVTVHHPPPSEDVDDVPANAWVQCEMEETSGVWIFDVEYCPREDSTGAGSSGEEPAWIPVRRPSAGTGGP